MLKKIENYPHEKDARTPRAALLLLVQAPKQNRVGRDNLKNRIVSAATGKGVVLPDEPEMSEEERREMMMNTPYTTHAWNSATGAAKQIALATAQGAGAVAETFANIWNTTPKDFEKFKGNVKEGSTY